MRLHILVHFPANSQIQEKSLLHRKNRPDHASLFFFTHQSNIINRLIAQITTFIFQDFNEFRAAKSLNHETLTAGQGEVPGVAGIC